MADLLPLCHRSSSRLRKDTSVKSHGPGRTNSMTRDTLWQCNILEIDENNPYPYVAYVRMMYELHYDNCWYLGLLGDNFPSFWWEVSFKKWCQRQLNNMSEDGLCFGCPLLWSLCSCEKCFSKTIDGFFWWDLWDMLAPNFQVWMRVRFVLTAVCFTFGFRVWLSHNICCLDILK